MYPLQIRQQFAVSNEDVFDAWTKPEIMKLWLFKSADNQISHIEIDLSEGGKFSILEINNGIEIDHYGEFLEVSKPCRLVFSLRVPIHFNSTSYVIVEIEPIPYGSELTFTQSGIDTHKTEMNWRDMLDNLNNVLETRRLSSLLKK